MAWIYWNETEWLISLSSDGETWLTIADKNLGATQVYNNWDALSENNSGKYYQWWNNNAFPFTWATTTSSATVDASNYWPWNYYNSNTWISQNQWDSSNNNNLWWWETNTYEAMRWPCQKWWHIPNEQNATTVLNILSWFNISGYADIETYLKMPLSWLLFFSDWRPTNRWGTWWIWLSVKHTTDDSWKVFGWYNSVWTINIEATSKWNWVHIRPFKNEAVIPYANEWWTKLYWDELPDRPIPPEPPKPKLKRIVKWANYYFFWDNRPTHASGITLNKNSITLNNVWDTEQLTATVTPEDAVNKKVLWSSSDTSIATVSSTGLVTCVTPGSCTITATCADGGASTSCSVSNAMIVDLLLVWWWAGWWCATSWYCRWWWGWGWWWITYCSNFELTQWNTYNIHIWSWWWILANWCPSCVYNNDWLLLYSWWWGRWWWTPNWNVYNACDWDWWWWGSPWWKIYCWWQSLCWKWNWWVSTWACTIWWWGWWGWWCVGWNWCNWCASFWGNASWWNWWNWICTDISWELQWYWWWGWWWAWCKQYSTDTILAWLWQHWWWNWWWCILCSGAYVLCTSNNATYYWWWGWWWHAYWDWWWCWCQWIFVLRYPTACWYDITWWCKYTCGDYTIHCFTSDWTLSVS